MFFTNNINKYLYIFIKYNIYIYNTLSIKTSYTKNNYTHYNLYDDIQINIGIKTYYRPTDLY